MGKQLDSGPLNSIVSFIMYVVLIVFGLRAFKIANGGFLTLGEALKTGIAIALVGSILSLIYTYIFMTYIEPDFMSQMMELQRQKMLDANPNLSDEKLEAMTAMGKKFSSPAVILTVGLIWSIFLGFIISLIAGLIMKKTPEKDY